MSDTPRAILLAAGLGSRMRPLTDTTPKPLLTLGGRALLDHALDRLAAAGANDVVVNAHWHADKLAAHLATRPPPPTTVMRFENTLLDTGGAVLAALAERLLGGPETPFFVINSDSVWLDGPISTLNRLRTALKPELDGVILVHRTFQVHARYRPRPIFSSIAGACRAGGGSAKSPPISTPASRWPEKPSSPAFPKASPSR